MGYQVLQQRESHLRIGGGGCAGNEGFQAAGNSGYLRFIYRCGGGGGLASGLRCDAGRAEVLRWTLLVGFSFAMTPPFILNLLVDAGMVLRSMIRDHFIVAAG